MAKVKYIRVSTEEQNTARQEINAKDFSKIYKDKISGSIQFTERKEAKKLISDIENGMISEIHVNSIDRLGRNIIDILNTLEYFNKKSINLYVENIGMYSLIENKPNSTFKLLYSILGTVAELDRLNILEKQRSGIQARKALGLYRGRLYGTVMTTEEILNKYKTVVKELKNGESLRRAAKIGGCSLGTAQKIQRIIATLQKV